MGLIPLGLATVESAAERLRVDRRRLRRLADDTPLKGVAPIHLGRARGSFRPIPQLGVLALRQADSRAPQRRLARWYAALGELLASGAWREVLARLGRDAAWRMADGGGPGALERLLGSPALLPAMALLHRETGAVLDRHGLGEQVQSEDFLVDRLEDEDDAVVLLGPGQRAFLLPRPLLAAAGLEREGARGVLTATRTGLGIALDVWRPLGVAEEPAVPDPEVLALRFDVGAPPRVAVGA